MTVTNKSKIPADLILDLRTDDENPNAPDGIECLEIIALDKADESILKRYMSSNNLNLIFRHKNIS
jgi:hypothetical protein